MSSGVIRFQGHRCVLPINAGATIIVKLGIAHCSNCPPLESYAKSDLLELHLTNEKAILHSKNLERLAAGTLTISRCTIKGPYVAHAEVDRLYVEPRKSIAFRDGVLVPGMGARSGSHYRSDPRGSDVTYVVEMDWAASTTIHTQSDASPLRSLHQPVLNDVIFVFPKEATPERHFLWANSQQLAARSEHFRALFASQVVGQCAPSLPGVQQWYTDVKEGLSRIMADARGENVPNSSVGTVASDPGSASIRYIVVKDHAFDVYEVILTWFLTGDLPPRPMIHQVANLYYAATSLKIVPIQDFALDYTKKTTQYQYIFAWLLMTTSKTPAPLKKTLLDIVRANWNQLVKAPKTAAEYKRQLDNAADKVTAQNVVLNLLDVIQPATQAAAARSTATA